MQTKNYSNFFKVDDGDRDLERHTGEINTMEAQQMRSLIVIAV